MVSPSVFAPFASFRIQGKGDRECRFNLGLCAYKNILSVTENSSYDRDVCCFISLMLNKKFHNGQV